MKTFDQKDVYSWSNAENAKKYIGKEGYFADSLKELQECVSNDDFYTLFSIDFDSNTDVDSIFSITNIDYRYALFLPLDKVKEVEEPKKYRPFTDIEEFLKLYKVGQVVHIRPTDDRVEEETLIIALFPTCTNCVCFGSMLSAISLEDLFECYEIKLNGKWQPFGVEE